MSPEELQQLLNEYLSGSNGQNNGSSSNSSTQDFNNSTGSSNNSSNSQNSDRDSINGFQDMDPNIFCIIGELAGQVVASNLPFNVQNALGNWLVLVGQVIITFNSQQQYFIAGEGRKYYSELRDVLSPLYTHSADNSNNTVQNAVNSTPANEANLNNENINANNMSNGNMNNKQINDELDSITERLRKIQQEIDSIRANNNK